MAMPDFVDPTTMQPLTASGVSVFALIMLCLLALLTSRGRRAYQRIEQEVSRFAERRMLAACVLFVCVIGVRLMALPLLPVPTPAIHDEFSYLLMGDTFAHGRLTNPTHPLWLSFETFHVNWHPTYSSMYPPAQGLVLAIGQLLGHPWIGILLSNAAMCVVIFWGLQGWMPARWAFLGALVATLKLCVTSYWINSYWGGAVATLGGALVIGGLGRLRRRARARDALVLALGAGILANSRPYEGFFFCLPVVVWFVLWVAGKIRSKDSLRVRLWNGLLPAAGLLVLTGAFIGYYNWRLTGNPLLMPHTMNVRTYHTTPIFLWQQAKPELQYNNRAFKVFYNGFERTNYHYGWTDAKRISREKLDLFRTTYFWPGALLALPALPFLLMDRKIRMLWAMLAAGAAAIFMVTMTQAHYAAPLACAFYVLLVQAMRHLRTMRLAKVHIGVALSRAIILLLVLETAMHLCYRVCDPLFFPCRGNPERALLVAKLEHMPGKHLIVVRYPELHNPNSEWVFNGADIDGGKIVWARDMGPEQNAKLLAYFKDRHVWEITADTKDANLAPYIAPDAASTRASIR